MYTKFDGYSLSRSLQRYD